MADRSSPAQPTEPRSDRRQFFLRGLSQALTGLLGVVEKSSPLPLACAPVARPRSVLRPPGALPEHDFLKTCYRCGNCVDACPPKALKPVQGQDEEVTGTPFLDPDVQGCETCEGFPCVQACPSGALVPMTFGRKPPALP